MNTLTQIVAVFIGLFLSVPGLAQNPIQWNSNARGAIDRAREQQLPVMFWVTEGSGGDGGDLRDAQSESFRDPIVVAIAEHHFVPVRVGRNSRVLEEAQRLGLPTRHGLFVAIVTAEGRVIDQIDPGQVADPEVFARRLTEAFRSFRDGLYRETLRDTLINSESSMPSVRRALDTIWRLNILSADRDIVGLLDRADLSAAERRRIFSLLASFATGPSVEALLTFTVKGDPDAASSLGRAEAGALEFLLTQLPAAESPTPVQIAAYEAAARLVRMQRRPAAFWTDAAPEERAREVEALRSRGTAVLEYWQGRIGHWR